MSNVQDDWFAGFGGTAMRARGLMIAAGIYVIELNRFTRQLGSNPQKTKGHQLAVLECTVIDTLQAYPAEVNPAGQELYRASNNPGERCSWVQDPSAHGEVALANIKNLLFAALNQVKLVNGEPVMRSDAEMSPEMWQQALMEATTPPGDALRGLRLVANGTKAITSGKKLPIVPVLWEPALSSGALRRYRPDTWEALARGT